MSTNISFQVKNSKKLPSIPGTRVSTTRCQTLVSSGIISLDCILGGGIPVGNIVLVEEDEYGFFAQLFLRYFVSEGIVCGHSTLLASLDVNTVKLVEDLPGLLIADVPSHDQLSQQVGSNPSCSSELKIAWRYHDTPVVQSAPMAVFGHQFSLLNRMPSDYIANAEIFHWQPSQEFGSYHDHLLQTIEDRLQKGGHKWTDQEKPLRRTVLRIGIQTAGSTLWGSPHLLVQFLYRLRALIHTSLSVCYITVPFGQIKAALSLAVENECNISLISRCRHLSDCAFELESLANNASPFYMEYNGLIHIRKLSTTNNLAPPIPDTVNWAFKLRKKRLLVEKLHLPPELSDTMQREQDDQDSSCSGGIGAVDDIENCFVKRF